MSIWNHCDGVMIDIASLGVATDSAILFISACEFNISEGTIGKPFSISLNATEAKKEFGLKVSKNTMEFWNSKPTILKNMVRNPVGYRDGLLTLSSFIQNLKPKMVWANGTHFDFSLLKHSYQVIGENTPWYSNICDVGTIKNCFGGEMNKEVLYYPPDAVKEQSQFIIDFFKQLAD